jgi:putative inorganic carbon (hco3(-)) transporter
MLSAQYLTHSLGAWVGTAVAVLFIAALSIRSRKMLLLGIALFTGGMVVALIFFHMRIYNLIFENHVDVRNISTTTKRLYLWRTAWDMIRNSPWLGYGLDNWLCHFSLNNVCPTPNLHHYIINEDPVTHVLTGLGYEPDLSHPHNVFLHIWVSMGIFGVVAFAAVLVLFFWLFARILIHLRANETPKNVHLQWMTIGVGAAMLAAMAQGMVDSAFLEQDLAFCFWMLVVALLVLRVLSGTPWRGRGQSIEDGTHSQIKG